MVTNPLLLIKLNLGSGKTHYIKKSTADNDVVYLSVNESFSKHKAIKYLRKKYLDNKTNVALYINISLFYEKARKYF